MSVGLWINIVFKNESKFAVNTFGICVLSNAADHSPLVRVSADPTCFLDAAMRPQRRWTWRAVDKWRCESRSKNTASAGGPARVGTSLSSWVKSPDEGGSPTQPCFTFITWHPRPNPPRVSFQAESQHTYMKHLCSEPNSGVMETQGGLSKQQNSFICSVFIWQYFKVTYLTLQTVGTGLWKNFSTNISVMAYVIVFQVHWLGVISNNPWGGGADILPLLLMLLR